MVINDPVSFLEGVAVGLRLKTWDLSRTIPPPPISTPLQTEADEDLLTEYEATILTE